MNNKKYGFTAIGYIENLNTYLGQLSKITGIERIDTTSLNAAIQEVWDNRYEKTLCLNRNLEPVDSRSNDISFILIDTGLVDSIKKETVYGGFFSTVRPTSLDNETRKWCGVTLGTKDKIISIWENLPFVKTTELDQHTCINTYTGLAAYISRITDCEYTPLKCKQMLNESFLKAKSNKTLGICKEQICYFQIPEISNENTIYYAYSKRNNRFPEIPTEWFKLYIVTEAELIDIILDILCFHIGDLLFEDINAANK